MRHRTRTNVISGRGCTGEMVDTKTVDWQILHPLLNLYYSPDGLQEYNASASMSEVFDDVKGPNHTYRSCDHASFGSCTVSDYIYKGYRRTERRYNYLTNQYVYVKIYSCMVMPRDFILGYLLNKCSPLNEAPALSVATKKAAAEALVTSTKPDVSLINFFIELAKFDDMFKFAISKHVVKDTAGNWLWFNFGVVPFVSDLKKIYNTKGNVDKRLRIQRQLYAKPAKVHGSSEQSTSWTGWKTEYWGPFIFRYRRRFRLTYGITARVRADKPNWQDRLTATIQSLGLILDPSIVWEAIPFSWAADYFLPIQETLSDCRLDAYNPFHIGTVYGTSLKIASECEFMVAANSSNIVWSSLGSCSIEHYVRAAGGDSPSIMAGVNSTPITFPNARQFSYMVSVAIQRL